MSAPLVPTPAGFLHSDIDSLLKLIQDGDGMGWPGDPRMYIAIGVVRVPGIGTARRYEVWRLCEDGEDRFIGGWKLEEKDKIVFDLTRMRPDSPGFVSAADQMKEHNAKLEAQAQADYEDAAGEMMSHLSSIVSETNTGKNTFRQMPGRRDDPGYQKAKSKLILPNDHSGG